ncbi:hypothetical protein AVEN_215553-1 [Araneus ventricosus]|uniref:PiggyBac transposable element-derived protein domain-containing protein n=1 Tax=Araneus ventricosus TaxID=182803 RepID=A0A4Y2BEX3_ARAVE|nr:hypothetical protein AVEN_215553-1 [Araneus ventricosus]
MRLADFFTLTSAFQSKNCLCALVTPANSVRQKIVRCRQIRRQGHYGHRQKTDKLARVVRLLDSFNENCQKCYRFDDQLTIDEKLEPFRGRC